MALCQTGSDRGWTRHVVACVGVVVLVAGVMGAVAHASCAPWLKVVLTATTWSAGAKDYNGVPYTVTVEVLPSGTPVTVYGDGYEVDLVAQP